MVASHEPSQGFVEAKADGFGFRVQSSEFGV